MEHICNTYVRIIQFCTHVTDDTSVHVSAILLPHYNRLT